ncbi:MAG TPA: TIGR02466 family protein [Sphingomicrobium sp.]
MPARSLFVTRLYEADLGDGSLLEELAHSIRTLAEDDEAGQRWSSEHRYSGYTSYASLGDLPKRDPAFADLARLLNRHAVAFAEECAFALARKPKLDSLWVNLLKGTGHHSAHIHPHSIISGTLYVEVPPGSGAIRFEDPRLPLMMAAPTRRPDAPEELRPFVTIEPRPGLLLLWESWLRHEVLPGTGRGERLSISFNFA